MHAPFNHDARPLPSRTISETADEQATRNTLFLSEEDVRRAKRTRLNEYGSYTTGSLQALSTTRPHDVAVDPPYWRAAASPSTGPFHVNREDRTITQVFEAQDGCQRITSHSSIQHFGPRILHTNIYVQQSFQCCLPAESDAASTNSLIDGTSDVSGKDADECCDDGRADVVCYGALLNLDIVDLEVTAACTSGLHWKQSCLMNEACHKVPLSERTVHILTALSAQAGVQFEFSLEQTSRNQVASRQRIRCSAKNSYSLTAVLYGPRDVSEDVGDWLDSIELYLQTPTFSNTDVPYHNPHKMLDSGMMTTCQLISLQQAPEGSEIDSHPADALDIFTTRTFEEAKQPFLIRSPLHRHQKQALTFMQGRELGWDLDNDRSTNDLWRCKPDNFGRKKYVDSLTGNSYFKPPDGFRGGFLADEMGLGKTCSMLSLMVSSCDSLYNSSSALSQQATLVVVPLPLLHVWEKQINEHLRPDSIRFLTYHGPRRKQYDSLAGLGIILTTYNTVAKEWKSQKLIRSREALPPLFQRSWHRIVLDEAHIIKNKDTDLAKAVSRLEGECRWCITGTPIQNRSSDLYSLLRFLKVYPYNNLKSYEETFVQPLKTNAADISALQNLQKLMRTLAIRRPRTVIELPARKEDRVYIDFTADEARIYEEGKQRAIRVIEQAFADDGQHAGSSYINALQRINELRYICNHGTAPLRKRHEGDRSVGEGDPGSIQRELDLLVTGDSASLCVNCGTDLSEEQENDNECLRVAILKTATAGSRLCANCSPSEHPQSQRQTHSISSTPNSSGLDTLVYNEPVINFMSSKVRTLVCDIQRLPPQDKCAIFSYWTSTLNMISSALASNNISHTRYDGSMSRKKRESVLTSFTTSSDKVILVSISCGGQGLDLTAANHAYLVEPQWNPMLEEQAMSRVHRLGQKKPVRLVRFIVRGTWEEKIVALQERKRMLAELIVDGPGENIERLSDEEGRRQLAMLRDLIT